MYPPILNPSVKQALGSRLRCSRGEVVLPSGGEFADQIVSPGGIRCASSIPIPIPIPIHSALVLTRTLQGANAGGSVSCTVPRRGMCRWQGATQH